MNPLHALRIDQRGPVAWVWMARAAVHNAFDERLIDELSSAFAHLGQDAGTRVVVLAGEGKSFSAGADLAWMQRQGQASVDENLADARRLAQMLRTLAECPKPTVARVHGAALGGGMGLAAACDVCIASSAASFATSEVKFGLIPSAISPYVLRAIGARQATRYFQTAERIDAPRALALGLAHEVCEPEQLDATVQRVVDALQAGGPRAQAAAKELIRAVSHAPVNEALVDDTARRIAALRASPEAREGLAAFLEKRPADWTRP